jgi:hypothetical protein
LALTLNARLAHEGHDHTIMGTVTMTAADHVMLKDKDGKDIIITATQAKDTSFTAKTIEVGVATSSSIK